MGALNALDPRETQLCLTELDVSKQLFGRAVGKHESNSDETFKTKIISKIVQS